MTEETTEATPDLNNVNISIEQICASIINKFGKVDLTVAELVQDFSSKSIAVNQDPETQVITFELADAPVFEPTETE